MDALSCTHCLAASPAGLPPQAWEAALKAFSLGYLLSLPALALAACAWRIARPWLSPALRAEAGSSALLLCVALQPLLAGLVWYGVVTHRILMTTNYFHHLMHGGLSRAIAGGGLIVLGLSLLVAAWGWRRAQPPRRARYSAGWPELDGWRAEAAAAGLQLHPARGVATAALVGAARPLLLVNPRYWAALSAEQRALALAHEREHLRRRDNLRKLLLEGCALLYGLLGGVRRWAAHYELDSELAVDDRCRLQGEAAYRELVAGAASWALAAGAPQSALRPGAARLAPGGISHLGEGAAPRSELGVADLGYRLACLARPRPGGSRLAAPALALACALLSAAPVLLLLSHPVPRCLLACYLGY